MTVTGLSEGKGGWQRRPRLVRAYQSRRHPRSTPGSYPESCLSFYRDGFVVVSVGLGREPISVAVTLCVVSLAPGLPEVVSQTRKSAGSPCLYYQTTEPATHAWLIHAMVYVEPSRSGTGKRKPIQQP